MIDLNQNLYNLSAMINTLRECDAFILYTGYVKMNEKTKEHILKEYGFRECMDYASLNLFGVTVVLDDTLPVDTFYLVFDNNVEITL